jgi:hypothetical protein
MEPSELERLNAKLGHTARMLWDIQGQRVATNNRIKAMERDGLMEEDTDELSAFLEVLEKSEGHFDRYLGRLAKSHPLGPWVQAQPGIGLPGFGRLIGCTGPFFPVAYEDGKVKHGFPNVAKLWAYLGLHVKDGKAPKKTKGEAANWSQQGRKVCYQIGESIVKVGRGPYRQAYDDTKAKYLARPRVGDSGCPMGYVHKDAKGKVLQCIKTDEDGHETSAHIHAVAIRYAVKELLKDMWIEWQRIALGAESGLEPGPGLPPSQSADEEQAA